MNSLVPKLRADYRPAFTLLELMIVLVIAMIAAVLVLPLVGDSAASKLRAAAGTLQADLSYAQAASITHADDLRLVSFDTTTDGYHIAASSAPATPLTNPIGGSTYARTYGTGNELELSGVEISALAVGGDDLLGFGAYGQLDQVADATITLSTGGRSVVVTVDSATGETAIGGLQ